MSQWMMQLGNRSKGPVEGYVSQPNFPTKHSAGNVYGRRSRMVNSDGAPSPYNPDAAQLAAVRSIEHHSTDHMIPGKNYQYLKKKNVFFFPLPLRWTNPFLHIFDSPQTTDTTTSTNLTSKSASSSQTNTSQYLVLQSESYKCSFFCLRRVNWLFVTLIVGFIHTGFDTGGREEAGVT